MADAFEIGGLRDLLTTFRELEPALAKALRAELREVAEPVKGRAEQNVGAKITNILSPTAMVDWWQMRTGTSVDGVYVAPGRRGTRDPSRKRRNLAGLLETQMDAALEEKTPEIAGRMELMVDRLIERYG
jgi:hypothetical protein